MDCEARGAREVFELRDVYTLHWAREKTYCTQYMQYILHVILKGDK